MHDYFGTFSTRGERYYFTRGEIEPTRGEIEPTRGEIETNIGVGGGKLRKKPKFLFGWRGHLVTIFDQFTFFRWTISKHSSGT